MYGLENNVSLGFLKGRQLIQILVGAHQLILRFDKDVSISVEGDFDHKRGNHSLLTVARLPGAASTLLLLIGQTITTAENAGEGETRLHFSNGETLCLIDSNETGESYEIQGPEADVIV
jgi:hypothetical protein